MLSKWQTLSWLLISWLITVRTSTGQTCIPITDYAISDTIFPQITLPLRVHDARIASRYFFFLKVWRWCRQICFPMTIISLWGCTLFRFHWSTFPSRLLRISFPLMLTFYCLSSPCNNEGGLLIPLKNFVAKIYLGDGLIFERQFWNFEFSTNNLTLHWCN